MKSLLVLDVMKWIHVSEMTNNKFQSSIKKTFVTPIDEKERFILFRSRGLFLITKASQTQNSYELLNKIFDEAESHLENEEPNIKDDVSKRPERPKKNK